MRLKTRLLLSFVVLALVPIAIVVPKARSELRHTLERELEQRMQSAETATSADISQRTRDVREVMETLSNAKEMEKVAQDLRARITPSQLSSVTKPLMSTSRLSVLSILDAKGVTLSAGHLPARMGDPDPDLFAITRVKEPEPKVALVEVRGNEGLRKMPALVTARPVEYGELKLWVVGGMLLDESVARHLSELTGTRVEIEAKGGTPFAEAGEALPPLIQRRVE